MDLSLALARKERAELVVANDPDADRLAVAVPAGRGSDGWVQLTGNQVGVLLGHHLLTRARANGAKRLVITTIVSSPMLSVIAAATGARYEETLTGFKWIATRAIDLARSEGLDFVFGYEEALGYTVSTLVRDKDGVSAAVVFADLVATLRAKGVTVLGQLEALAREYGLYVSDQVSVTKKGADGSAAIRAIMDRLRREAPTHIGSLEVLAIRDYRAQTRLDRTTGATSRRGRLRARRRQPLHRPPERNRAQDQVLLRRPRAHRQERARRIRARSRRTAHLENEERRLGPAHVHVLQ
jgi:phosphomannomutase